MLGIDRNIGTRPNNIIAKIVVPCHPKSTIVRKPATKIRLAPSIAKPKRRLFMKKRPTVKPKEKLIILITTINKYAICSGSENGNTLLDPNSRNTNIDTISVIQAPIIVRIPATFGKDD